LKSFEEEVKGYEFMAYVMQIVQEHFASLMTLLFNAGLIPIAIALLSEMDDHKTKSKLQLSVMYRTFFFLMVIAIFLQLSVQATILSFITYMTEQSLEAWPVILGKNLVDSGFVFLKYTIQAAFFSNGLLLLDVGHQIIVWFKKRAHKSSQQYHLKP